MKKVLFLVGNVVFLGVIPSFMIWAVGNHTVLSQYTYFCTSNHIILPPLVIEKYAQHANAFFFEFRTIVLCVYVFFLSFWVLNFKKFWLSFLEDI